MHWQLKLNEMTSPLADGSGDAAAEQKYLEPILKVAKFFISERADAIFLTDCRYSLLIMSAYRTADKRLIRNPNCLSIYE